MKTFSQIKQDIFERKDKSDIGKIDWKIRKLCEKINKKKEYYTTSSCAGRIVLIIANEKKKSGLFLFRNHEKIKLDELKREIERAGRKTKKLIYFKQEPCILHVACLNLEYAQKLLNKAKLAGWKNSGIMASNKKIILEMRSTEKIELPIIKNKKLLVDDDFLKVLVKEANERLERTWDKIEKLSNLLNNSNKYEFKDLLKLSESTANKLWDNKKDKIWDNI